MVSPKVTWFSDESRLAHIEKRRSRAGEDWQDFSTSALEPLHTQSKVVQYFRGWDCKVKLIADKVKISTEKVETCKNILNII